MLRSLRRGARAHGQAWRPGRPDSLRARRRRASQPNLKHRRHPKPETSTYNSGQCASSPRLALAAVAAGIAASDGTRRHGARSTRLSSSFAPRRAAPMPRSSPAAGGTVVAPSLGLYLVPNSCRARARAAPPRARLAAARARRTGSQAPSPCTDFSDPLVPTEWWRPVIGVDTLAPPAPVGRSRSSIRAST